MERYVDSTNELAEGALWPLVKRVQLLGPWPVLASGAVLVDAPGVQDDNSARDQVCVCVCVFADARAQLERRNSRGVVKG